MQQKDWIQEMIELEATPRRLRKETVVDFCKRNSVASSTYYYELSKEENKKRILEITLGRAKDRAPDILEKLGDAAEAGDMRAMDIYVDSILKLAKNIDVKSDGEPITGINYILPNGNNSKTNAETTPSV
jgi:hypothetical protein